MGKCANNVFCENKRMCSFLVEQAPNIGTLSCLLLVAAMANGLGGVFCFPFPPFLKSQRWQTRTMNKDEKQATTLFFSRETCNNASSSLPKCQVWLDTFQKRPESRGDGHIHKLCLFDFVCIYQLRSVQIWPLCRVPRVDQCPPWPF